MPQKSLVSGLRARRSDPRVGILFIFVCLAETMSNCSQNCLIDWNSASCAVF